MDLSSNTTERGARVLASVFVLILVSSVIVACNPDTVQLHVQGTVYSIPSSGPASSTKIARKPFPENGRALNDATVEYRLCENGCGDDWVTADTTDETGWYEIERTIDFEVDRVQIRAKKSGYELATSSGLKTDLKADNYLNFYEEKFMLFRLREVEDE